MGFNKDLTRLSFNCYIESVTFVMQNIVTHCANLLQYAQMPCIYKETQSGLQRRLSGYKMKPVVSKMEPTAFHNYDISVLYLKSLPVNSINNHFYRTLHISTLYVKYMGWQPIKLPRRVDKFVV